jgi:hypothetical protein
MPAAPPHVLEGVGAAVCNYRSCAAQRGLMAPVLLWCRLLHQWDCSFGRIASDWREVDRRDSRTAIITTTSDRAFLLCK